MNTRRYRLVTAIGGYVEAGPVGWSTHELMVIATTKKTRGLPFHLRLDSDRRSGSQTKVQQGEQESGDSVPGMGSVVLGKAEQNLWADFCLVFSLVIRESTFWTPFLCLLLPPLIRPLVI